MEGGIFGGDQVEGTGTKHYSNIATCIRALIPLSSLRVLALDHSLLSLLSLYYGRLNADLGLVDFAHLDYTIALGQYSRVLEQFSSKKPKVSTKAYQIFACISIALQMFKFLTGVETESAEDQSHMKDVLTDLQCCGPHFLQMSPEMRNAFCGLRGPAAFLAIEQREGTFLADPDWLTVPFENVGKSMRDQLNDLALQVPSLLECSDTFAAGIANRSSPQYVECGRRLLMRVANLQQRLAEWLDAFKTTTSEPLYWSRSLPVTYAKDGYDIEWMPRHTDLHQFRFLSAPVAGLPVHYWSCIL